MVGRGSGKRVAEWSDGVGVGVVVWEGSVMVGVGLPMRFCVEGADADLAGGTSGIMSIGVAEVFGHSSWGRELELRYVGPRRELPVALGAPFCGRPKLGGGVVGGLPA